tara:strand:- start:656 stop:1636 length:981 start_codon:yes stop_codon:yes gene_type:complete
MNNTIKFFISKTFTGERLDLFLTKKLQNFTRSYVKKQIVDKKVKINNLTISSPSKKLKQNDKIEINIIKNATEKLRPAKIKLDIIYEDKDLLIVNKQKGMVVHPGAGNLDNTLANALAYIYKENLSDINGEFRPGIVHRIDKETSGLLVIAKNNLTHSELGKQFSSHSIKRKYLCLIWGVIRPINGKIQTLITRNIKNRQLMTVSEVKGKKAITNYKTLKVYNLKDVPKISLLECELETGRTHQIRVHLKFKGTSILGDKQYGKERQKYKKINSIFYNKLKNLNGQALHAQTLEFNHPTRKKWVSFKSNIPSDFKKMIDFLNKQAG